jgi:hypothetical protein
MPHFLGDIAMKHVSILLSAFLFLPLPASAAVLYSYAGKNFDRFYDDAALVGTYDTNDRITGWFSTDNVLSGLGDPSSPYGYGPDISALVTDFSFSDGRSTLTKSDNLELARFRITTDATGAIVEWEINLWTKLFNSPSLSAGGTYRSIRTRTALNSSNPGDDVGEIAFCFADPCSNFQNLDYDAGINSSAGLAPGASFGSWTRALPAVPLPAGLPLLFSAIFGFALTRRLKSK